MSTTHRYQQILALGAFFAAALSLHSQTAWTVQPFEVYLGDSGREARQAYQLTNSSARPISVEITAWKRMVTDEGDDIRGASAEDVFLIVPAQVVIPPGSRRTVRVQYVGDPVQKEEAYRLLFAEATDIIESEEDLNPTQVHTRMNISIRYNSRLFIRPSDVDPKPAPEVTSWSTTEDTIKLAIANNGAVHAILGRYAIALQTATEPQYFPLKDDAGILLAGGKRNYQVPLPTTIQAGEIRDVAIVEVAQ